MLIKYTGNVWLHNSFSSKYIIPVNIKINVESIKMQSYVFLMGKNAYFPVDDKGE